MSFQLFGPQDPSATTPQQGALGLPRAPAAKAVSLGEEVRDFCADQKLCDLTFAGLKRAGFGVKVSVSGIQGILKNRAMLSVLWYPTF